MAVDKLRASFWATADGLGRDLRVDIPNGLAANLGRPYFWLFPVIHILILLFEHCHFLSKIQQNLYQGSMEGRNKWSNWSVTGLGPLIPNFEMATTIKMTVLEFQFFQSSYFQFWERCKSVVWQIKVCQCLEKCIYQGLPDRGFLFTLRFVVNSGWTLSIALFERSISHKMVFLS